jgi:hypothetical protein
MIRQRGIVWVVAAVLTAGVGAPTTPAVAGQSGVAVPVALTSDATPRPPESGDGHGRRFSGRGEHDPGFGP